MMIVKLQFILYVFTTPNRQYAAAYYHFQTLGTNSTNFLDLCIELTIKPWVFVDRFNNFIGYTSYWIYQQTLKVLLTTGKSMDLYFKTKG